MDTSTGRSVWGMEQLEPHVAIKAKRIFSQVAKYEHGRLIVFETLEACRDLLWFLDRYPLKLSETDRGILGLNASRHRERESLVDRMVRGVYEAQTFKLALEPRDYQRVAADMVLETGGLLLADDLGLGKTCVGICMISDPRTRPALVVTLTHLVTQWESEFKKFAPWLTTHVLKSKTPYDIVAPRALPGQHVLQSAFPDVVISTYTKMADWGETLAPILKSVVWDECQDLRAGDSTAKGGAAALLADSVAYRLGLSATPIHNYGGEIWNVIRMIQPSALGTREEFLREWCGTTDGRGRSHLHDPKAFGSFIRDAGIMLRRTRADVKRELPPVVIVPHEVESNSEPFTEIKGAAQKLAEIILRKGQNSPTEKRDAAGQLDIMVRQATGIAKAPFVADFVRLLVETGEPVVLFGWHRECYSIWLERLKDLTPVLYTGSESPTQKNASRDKFLDGETNLLIMSLRSGAGLDGLQRRCRTVVFGEFDWSPSVHQQCIGRFDRDEQKSSVVAYYLFSNEGSDPLVLDVLQVKRAQAEGIRNPKNDLIENLDVSGARIRELAQSYLKKGETP